MPTRICKFPELGCGQSTKPRLLNTITLVYCQFTFGTRPSSFLQSIPLLEPTIPTFWHPTPDKGKELDSSQPIEQTSNHPEGTPTSTQLSTAQQATQLANQRALDKLPTFATTTNAAQLKTTQTKTQQQFLQQMGELLPATVTPITTKNTLAMTGTSITPGTFVKLPSGIFWYPAQDTYKTKSGLQLTPQRFTYQPHDTTDHKWTPDIQLTTARPTNKSLTSAQYESYASHQKHLQHLHLAKEWPPTTEIPLYYPPNATMPKGIAGVEFSCLMHELELKTYLVLTSYMQDQGRSQQWSKPVNFVWT